MQTALHTAGAVKTQSPSRSVKVRFMIASAGQCPSPAMVSARRPPRYRDLLPTSSRASHFGDLLVLRDRTAVKRVALRPRKPLVATVIGIALLSRVLPYDAS